MFEPIVTRTFHKTVEEGNSSFVVEVPASYDSVLLPNSEVRRRQFYFSDLYIIPGFYKQRAAQLGLELEEEEVENLIDLECRITFTISPDLYKDSDRVLDIKFQHTNARSLVQDLVKTVNAHFEATKPEGVVHSVFFLDWVDKQWMDENDESVILEASEVVPSMVSMYYGADEYTDEEFFNALEPSARKIPGVNNFKFPTQAYESPELWSSLRLRLHIAPNTKILASTDGLLKQLGFSVEQLGIPRDRKRYVFENPVTDSYITMVAENPIAEGGQIAGTATTIFPAPLKKTFQTDWFKMVPKMSDYDNNEYILGLVKEAFATLSSKANIFVGMELMAGKKQFRIVYPGNDRLGAVVHVDRDFSSRLGFEGRLNIDSSVLSVPIAEKNTKVDAEGQSRALVYDTVMIMVTMESSSSTITAGLDETLLACLYPTGSGTMAMTNRPPAQNYFSFDLSSAKSKHGEFYTTLYPRSVYLPTVYSGDREVPVKFNVWALGKGSGHTRINWKVPFSISGVLEGRI
jgi:hypothetical protein